MNSNNFDPVAVWPDGSLVAVTGLDGKILLYPLDNGATRAIPNLAEGFAPLRWCPEDSRMLYQAGNVPVKLLQVDVATGKQALWKELSPPKRTGLFGMPYVRVGADCQSLAYSATYFPSELWIVSGLR